MAGRWPARGPNATAYDKAEVEYRLYVDFCQKRDSVESVTPVSDESAEIQPLESAEIMVDDKTERKLLRAWKNLH
jgi:hypothetical protein